jgi:hypothetical protein
MRPPLELDGPYQILCAGILSLSNASQSQMDARTPPTTTYRRETILIGKENQSSGAMILGRKMETS